MRDGARAAHPGFKSNGAWHIGMRSNGACAGASAAHLWYK
jgi:hypothetical protein